jgi:hypothetical protein
MLNACRASEDGIVMRLFQKHRIYDVSTRMGRRMIAAGCAVYIQNLYTPIEDKSHVENEFPESTAGTHYCASQ